MNAVPAEHPVPLAIKPHLPRRVAVVAVVLALHALGLWAMQSGLMRQVTEQVTPVQVIAELVSTRDAQPEPATAPPLPAPPAAAPPRPSAAPRVPAAEPLRPPAAPAPTASVTAAAAPSPASPLGAAVSEGARPALQEPVLASSAATTTPTPSPAAAPPAPRVELPSSSADYLNNPKPLYPALSKRIGEQGRVVVRVLIDTNGSARQAEVVASSGYERLDQAAVQTALRWRYVPGKRNGVPEAMRYDVPLNFSLDSSTP